MAFIPDYEYDIFISYAHVDNLAFPGISEGWIEQFYKHLNLMLAKRFGHIDSVKIWWDDKKLDGSVMFDNSIEHGIKKAAIMICLNSPGYLESDYCRKELDLFYHKSQEEKLGLIVGERSRIINVLLNNIPYKDWPKELSGSSGFTFHDANDPDEFGDPFDTLSTEFKNQMQQLRNAIWQLLTDFKEQLQHTPFEDKKEEKDEKAFSIYLGEVADTLRRPRSRIIEELEKKGYHVLTGIPPPDEFEAHENETKRALEHADLAINLLDEYPGRQIIGKPEIWYPQKQTELALNSNVAQMIWVSPDINFEDIEEEKFKNFLQELETGKSAKKEYEFVRCSKNTLVQEIVDLAEEIKSRQIKVQPSRSKLSVLLDTHFNDQLYAMDLCKALIEGQVQPYINVQDDDTRSNLNLLGERLQQVKKLIFLYGSVSKDWVLERITASLQLIITNNYPIEDFYIYKAPPHKISNDITISQRFLKVNIFDGSDRESIDKSLLHQFLTDLKNG